ncbi:MAG: SIR2 family NAD-dependent protein deacylase [Pseudomonadota bacterium]
MSIDHLRDLLSTSKRAVVFTGAGISTESGIPDFRSPGSGLWTKYKPIYFDDFVRSEEMRRESWRRKFAMESVLESAKPNRGHLAVAQLVRRGLVSHIITQNIDNLHQDSGVPDERVIELHGNNSYARCLGCHERYEIDPIREAFTRDETLPVCDQCGGMIKTATISFGQSMPEREMRRAQDATLACDLMLVAGSSLVVFPAAGFPAMAKQNGAKLVIINREPTELDHMADLVLNAELGPTLGAAVGLN